MNITASPTHTQPGAPVTVRVDAVVYYRVLDPVKVVVDVQTVVEVAAEKNSALVLPFPVGLLRCSARSARPSCTAPAVR